MRNIFNRRFFYCMFDFISDEINVQTFKWVILITYVDRRFKGIKVYK